MHNCSIEKTQPTNLSYLQPVKKKKKGTFSWAAESFPKTQKTQDQVINFQSEHNYLHLSLSDRCFSYHKGS